MFTQSNPVEQMILDAVAQLGDALRPVRWTYALHTQ